MIETIDAAVMDEEAVRMEQALRTLKNLRRGRADNSPDLDAAFQTWIAESLNSQE